MDLLTLVTACSLAVDPKLMHAVVWHQSRGEPWAASMQNGALPRVYASMHEAIREVRSNVAASDTIRIGLAGVAVARSDIAPAVLLPCRNIAMAATQLAKLTERCKAHPRLKNDPTFCAVAVYRGSRDKPDVDFADAVEISFVRGNAPNFDISNDTGIEFLDIASDTPAPPANSASPESARVLEERKRGWSSALFPIRSQQSTGDSIDNGSSNAAAGMAPSTRVSTDSASPDNASGGLFVRRSSDRRPE
jgi:type IV secretion system protein VirB1